ncbi:MAG: hypothetical protein WDW38_003471 [Sanguina aurantia]
MKLLMPCSFLNKLSGAVVSLRSSNGQEKRTYTDADGFFSFSNVPAGSHIVNPFILGLMYPEIRVEISKRHGVIHAAMMENRQQVPHSPLLLKPMAEMQFFEKRKPFDLRSFAFSMPGMMIGGGILMFVILPRLKVDPEEFKEFKNSPAGAAMTGGAASSGEGAQQRVRDK